MSDSLGRVRGRDEIRVVPEAAVAAGEVRQLADGRAAIFAQLSAGATTDRLNYTTEGQFTLTKTSGVVLLDGGRAYWDYSAAAVTFEKVNDRDFYLGRIVGDAASGDTACVVNLNIDPPYDIDSRRDAFLSVPTGTQAVGGFGYPKGLGGARLIELTATNEAQCIDFLSVDKFDKDANAIVEAVIRVPTNGSGAAVDFNIGIANGTHATDFDSVTEYVAFHIDGGAVDILAQSKDGTTTVAATDTTKDISAGSAVANRVELWIDARDTSNVKLYVDGVRVLSGSTFKINAATGPFGLIAHLEKTTGTTVGTFVIDSLLARLAKQ